MTTLIAAHLIFGFLATAVIALVVLLYRGRSLKRAQRMTDVVKSAARRVHPGEAPPQGVLTTPEKSRQVSQRFEAAEQKVRRGARALTLRGD